MRFERSTDYALVRSLMAANYAMASDDGSASVETFSVNEDPRIWYVLAFDEDELLGMLMFLPESAVCWQVHFCMRASVRGRGARAMRAGFRWFFSTEDSCRRIVGSIPAYNRLAIRCVLAAGAKVYGLNPRSWMKAGDLGDQVLLGVGPEDV